MTVIAATSSAPLMLVTNYQSVFHGNMIFGTPGGIFSTTIDSIILVESSKNPMEEVVVLVIYD